MTPDQAPSGTLCSVGHPANGVIVRKVGKKWRYVNTYKELTDYDTIHKGLRVVWVPEGR